MLKLENHTSDEVSPLCSSMGEIISKPLAILLCNGLGNHASDESHFLGSILIEWLHSGDEEARKLFDDALRAFVSNDMIRLSGASEYQYFSEMQSGRKNDIMSFIACMSGGVYALGSLTGAVHTSDYEFLSIGLNLTQTCTRCL